MSITDTALGADVGAEVPADGLDSGSSIPSEGHTDAPSGSQTESAAEYLFEVEGERITREEAEKGYLRQRDYTRKTQELAEQRRQLQQAEALRLALEKDPKRTIEILAQEFGVKFGAQDNQLDPLDELDPDAKRIAELERRIARQEEAARQAAIDRELAALHERFGEFNEDELFAFAVANNFSNLEAAYKAKHFDDLMAELEAKQAKEAEEEKRLQAKREAQVVHGGGSRQGAVALADQEPPSSFREAFERAKRQLGLG